MPALALGWLFGVSAVIFGATDGFSTPVMTLAACSAVLLLLGARERGR